MGLGLIISKQIVSEYNGKISFISVFKQGSSFSFFMDLEESESVPDFGGKGDSFDQIDSSATMNFN